MINTTAPAHNTISRTQQAKTSPASRTRACTRITRMENKNQKGQASKLQINIAQLENDIHQALAVMDTDNGKLLNYRQLMRNPKYKNNWSISSTNEFRRLANEVSGRIKKPSKKI